MYRKNGKKKKGNKRGKNSIKKKGRVKKKQKEKPVAIKRSYLQKLLNPPTPEKETNTKKSLEIELEKKKELLRKLEEMEKIEQRAQEIVQSPQEIETPTSLKSQAFEEKPSLLIEDNFVSKEKEEEITENFKQQLRVRDHRRFRMGLLSSDEQKKLIEKQQKQLQWRKELERQKKEKEERKKKELEMYGESRYDRNQRRLQRKIFEKKNRIIGRNNQVKFPKLSNPPFDDKPKRQFNDVSFSQHHLNQQINESSFNQQKNEFSNQKNVPNHLENQKNYKQEYFLLKKELEDLKGLVTVIMNKKEKEKEKELRNDPIDNNFPEKNLEEKEIEGESYFVPLDYFHEGNIF